MVKATSRLVQVVRRLEKAKLRFTSLTWISAAHIDFYAIGDDFLKQRQYAGIAF